MDLNALRQKPERFAVGLMSGSSCDGVSAALVRIKGTGPNLYLKFIDARTLPYPTGLRMRLLAPRMDAREVCLLNTEVGVHLAEAAKDLIETAREDLTEVDFIASHGHTLAHLPPRPDKKDVGTLQIGEAAIIAEHTGLPVVSDFRQRDIAAGGQGAPLVPYANWLLFRRPDRTVACLNLGGVANLTVVTPELESVIAFDSGPANMVIDGAVRFLTRGNQEIDTDGAAAAKGVVIDEFLEYLLDHPYYAKVPPKSTGREDFGLEVFLRDALAARRDNSFEDLIATVTTAVAYTVIRAHTRFIKPQYEVARYILSGGGVHNKTLVRHLKKGLGDIVVRTSDEYGIPGDALEAVSFAILGNETLLGVPANVPKATGARRPVLLGKITPA